LIGDANGGGSVDRDDVYSGRMEPVLVSLSDLYSEEEISVCGNRPSSYPAFMFY